MNASAEHIKEAQLAQRSVENGSRVRDEGRDRLSDGIFSSFGLNRRRYIEEWLRSVYGETLSNERS